jgi:hypothetical protein
MAGWRFSGFIRALVQLKFKFLGFKNSANQEEDTKILFFDWLFQYLQENL